MKNVIKVHPSNLSDPAKMLYQKAVRSYRNLTLDTLSADEKEAVKEIEKAGLGTVSYGSLHVVNASKNFTVARGRGVFITSSRVDIYIAKPGQRDKDRLLLATVLGADVNFRDVDGWKEMIIESRHLTATDFEHDSAKIFYLTAINPNLRGMVAGRTEFTAVATDGRWYDFWVNPDEQGDQDTPAGTCKRCDDKHPLIRYMPPQKFDTPLLINVEVSPMPDDQE